MSADAPIGRAGHPTRVVLVSSMYSPFQNDLAHAMNARDDVEYHVVYTMNRKNQRGENQRGKHWTAERESANFIVELFEWSDARDLAAKLDTVLDRIKPDVIVANGILRAVTYAALQKVSQRNRSIPTGYWVEHPDLSGSVRRRIAIELVVRYQARNMDFMLAIGDRAANFYQRCAPRLPVHIVPYGQDLSHHFAIERATEPSPNEPVRFLFSGQLLPRNNIQNLTAAFTRLAESHHGQWQFVVAASGPEEPSVVALQARGTRGWEPVVFDRDYETWLDRIRPFATSDVLVCPSVHAGWALVVPEAMAAGMPIIATRNVGAARYFLRPEVNGIAVDTSVDSIYRALKRFVEDRYAIIRMSAAAREAATAGTAEFVATLFAEAVKRHAIGHGAGGR
ncbi:MAG: glycosyltransferase involved in cell wall biosynthesis [Myxococcota bacterium]|jgi:glycosyltransferase involved in cell wall biosynthesis